MKKTKLRILQMLVMDSFPDGSLGRICLADQEVFFKNKKGWTIHDVSKSVSKGWTDRYAFKDNGGSILAVAHCDTVFGGKHPYSVDMKDLKVFSPELDDRLGVYIISNLLPRLGVKCDVLLTENEEMCSSTATSFKTEKKYNWIMEWDRRGAGVVMYQYETPELKKLMEKYDFKVSIGTYSDIADLYELKIAAFNFATGYSLEHTKACFADLRCLAKQVAKFLRFYSENKDTRIESKAGARYYGRWSGRGWDSDYYGYYDQAGNWHDYAWTRYQASLSATSASEIVVKNYPTCVYCGKKELYPTAYRTRTRYVCFRCEKLCKTCFRRYSPDQMYDDETCMRCQMSNDAQDASIHHTCRMCNQDRLCVEFATDSWVCSTCIRNQFVICDNCKSVMPLGYTCADAAGICCVCRDKTKPKHVEWRCDGCNDFYEASKIRYSAYFGMNLCPECREAYQDDETKVLEEEIEEVEESGYGECDVCGTRDQLFDIEGVLVCQNCRMTMTSPGT